MVTAQCCSIWGGTVKGPLGTLLVTQKLFMYFSKLKTGVTNEIYGDVGVFHGVSILVVTLSDASSFAAASKPKEKSKTSGVLTSINYPLGFPGHYQPNDEYDSKQTIRAEKGSTIRIRFTDFALPECDRESFLFQGCPYFNITDGDGTLLAHIEQGPAPGGVHEICDWEPLDVGQIFSNSETVHVLFHAFNGWQFGRWRLVWGE